MSRIGKKPVAIPKGVMVELQGQEILIKGPKGEKKITLHRDVNVVLKDDKIFVSVRNPDEKKDRALWGLFRVLIANQIEGVEKGFEKKLELQGIGFKANIEGGKLVLEVGYSHPVYFKLPAGVEAAIDKNIITIKGIDKELVGAAAADIRAIKKPEPYQGKGIRYLGEVVRRKAGKAAKAAGVPGAAG